MIDHTNLKAEATENDILRLCSEAGRHRFKAVCVNPSRVALAARSLAGSGVAVCTVIGFPLGAATTNIKAAEAKEAVMSGAVEVDMVINLGLLKEGRQEAVFRDIRGVVEAAWAVKKDAVIKVIIETCFLSGPEKETACRLCERAGAGFVKTSTGMGPAGATVEDIRLIKKTISPGTGIKASGGIKTLGQALAMIEAGATRIGTSSGVQLMREMEAYCP
jgi:deoxyribose-phosphate aldolase